MIDNPNPVQNPEPETTPTPEVTGGKMFTQSEVNKIVSDRLAREREKLADGNEYKAQYEAIKQELESMKAAQAHQAKETAYRTLLATANISEKRIAAIMKLSAAEIDALKLDSSGAVIDSDKVIDHIKTEWADFIVTTEVRGAETAEPLIMHEPPPEDAIANAFKPKT